jgi:transcriptional regulator with XRE-family HTH domain
MTTFGQRVQAVREHRGLSQNQLAQRSGLPQATVSRIESGVRAGAGVEVLTKLALALGVSTDYLCGMHEHISKKKEPAAS